MTQTNVIKEAELDLANESELTDVLSERETLLKLADYIDSHMGLLPHPEELEFVKALERRVRIESGPLSVEKMQIYYGMKTRGGAKCDFKSFICGYLLVNSDRFLDELVAYSSSPLMAQAIEIWGLDDEPTLAEEIASESFDMPRFFTNWITQNESSPLWFELFRLFMYVKSTAVPRAA